MNTYFFYSKNDSIQEPIYYCKAVSRYNAGVKFAQGKRMDLKTFLSIYSVSRNKL
jgi:hypothetical protein